MMQLFDTGKNEEKDELNEQNNAFPEQKCCSGILMGEQFSA